MDYGIKDDLRQSVVVTRNEIRKFFRGRKMLLFGSLIVVILLLMTVLPYVLGDGYEDDYTLALVFVMFVAIIIELAGILFTATSLVSEYEERTALILFTRPVRKRAIFIGKLVASILVMAVFAVVYYAFTCVFSMVAVGGVLDNLWKSFGLTFPAIFAVCGMCMLMSSIFKKGSTASIMSMVMMMLLISVIVNIISTFSSLPTWWGFDEAMDSIIYALGDFDAMSGMEVDAYTGAELWRSVYVMLAWGIVTDILAYVVFKKRDF